MKNLVEKTIINIQERIFWERITPSVELFIKNLSYVVIGYGVVAFSVFVFQILGGRMLGPIEYGKYVLIDSLSLFSYFFMLLGINTAVEKCIKHSICQKRNLMEARDKNFRL